MSSKNFYGLTGDVTIDGGILNVANTNVSGNVTSTSLLVSNVATLGTTKTFVVTVDNSKYVIDGDSQASLELHEGQTYIFDITAPNASNPAHPFKLSQSQEHPGAVYQNGVEGYNTNYIKFTVPFGAPTTLYYYCQSHTGMGGQINISPTAELVVSGRIVASGNVEASKITASANVEVTGNVVASKFVGDGSLLTNVTGATTSGLQTVTDNSPTTTNTIQFTNPTTSLTASSNIVATGNVTADHFIGDGSQLSGIVTSVTFGDAVDTGNISSNTLLLTNAKEGLVATGNVVTQGKFIGDGSKLTGIVTSVNLSDAVNTGNTTSNTVQFTNVFTSLTASGNVEVTGNVIAGYFIGDGSRLTNLPGGSGGSGTSHWSKTSGTNELHYSAGSVGISNTTPVHDLSVGSNLYIDDDASDGILMVTGNVHGTYFVGDGSRLINLPEGGGSTNWTTSGSPVNKIYYPQNPGTTSVSVGIMNAAPAHTLSVGSNLFVDDTGSNVLVVDGDITAESMFLGALGIKPSYPLDTVTDAGNVTPHTISFTNPTLGITTASNVEIGGALVVGKGTLGGSNLEVGEANLFVNTQLTRVGIATDQPAATLHVNGSLAVDGPLTFGTVDVAAQHGLEAITAVNNTTPLTVELQNADTSLVTTGNVEVGGNVITSKDLMVTGNVTTNSELIVAGNVFYTNLTSVSVKSNVVTEYTGPHDRPLRKYPEVALTVDAETASGYKEYKVTASSVNTSASGERRPFCVFDGDAGTGARTNSGYASTVLNTSSADYDTSVMTITDTAGTAHLGHWLKLELPKRVRFTRAEFDIYDASYAFKDYVILGSDDDTNWTLLDEATAPNRDFTTHFTSTGYFKYILISIKTIYTTNSTWIINAIKYYGYEEGSASLDTTLKSVYNVPATTGTQLEVYYDGQDYTGVTSTVTDKVGTATNATITNTGSTITFDSTYKAWVFGGDTSRTDTFISAALPSSFVDDQSHSVSLWFNPSYVPPVTSSFGAIFSIALATGEANSQNIQIQLNGSDTFSYVFWNNDEGFDVPMGKSIVKGQWYHLSATYEPSTGTRNIFLNGEKCVSSGLGGANPGVDLDIQSGSVIKLGARINGTQEYFGSIANFRLYSKALNADQVKELYDYQKDYFLGSKSKVTLYKGHLGVGVTEPSGQLELAGDERLQEYPPGPMNDYDTHIPGHGVFTAIASSNYTYVNGAYNAFDKQHPTGTNGWASMFGSGATNDTYDGESHGIRTDGALPTGRDKLEGISGSWIGLKMPYDVKVTKIYWYPRFNNDGLNRRRETIQDGIIWGSKDGTNWVQLRQLSGVTYQEYALGGTYSNDDPFVFDINNKNYYDRYVIQLTKLGENTSGVGAEFATCQEIKFFGTPGPTTLDKGSLTLGRSLDVPRVSRYDVDTETPRPEKIVLDYDTTVNSSATDISGKGNHATFKGNSDYSPADKAFKFDGQGASYIKGSSLSGLPTGNAIYSLVGWINVKPSLSVTATVIVYGSAWGVSTIANLSVSTSYQVQGGIGGDHIKSTNAVITPNTWHHVAAVKKTSTGACNVDTIDLYVDGVLITDKTYVGISRTQNIGSTTYVGVGGGFTGAASDACDGLISNPKIYSVALEPSEVQKLYRLGRTGRSMVISDTAVGIGKVPEAQLDVRGIGKFETCHIRDGEISGTHGMLDINQGLRTAGSQIPPSHTPPLYVTGNFGSNDNGVEFRHSNQSQGVGIGYNTIYATGYASGGGQDLSLKAFGTGTVRLNGGTAITSDDRLKTNEQYLTNATETLLKLKPQVYDKHQKINEICENPVREAGLITQDVYYDVPELRFLVQARNEGLDSIIPVNIPEEKPFVDDDPTKDPDYSGWGTDAASLNYEGFIPYLIKSNQELYAEIQTLEHKDYIRELKIENNRLKNKVAILENRQTHFNTLLVNLTGRIETLERGA